LASAGDRPAVAQDGWIELAIDHDGVRLGTTIVGYTHTSLDQFVAKVRQENARWVGALHEAKGAALRSATASLVAILVAIAMTLGGVTYGAFHLLVKRRLAAMAERFRDVAEGEGDLRQRIEVGSADEIGRLATWFNLFMDKLHDIIVQVRTAADHVTAVSQQLSGAAAQLSVGAQEQATSLEETAASLEQITGTVKQNADNALQANQLAVGSLDTAGKGGQVVTSAVVSMQEITNASGNIAEIITVIDAIAFQTNLLALNAAVEAARAGDQGRGFAVVAAEVRNLAQRSGAAAKEIKGLIQDSVRKVRDGSALVHRSGQTFEEIMTSVRRVTEIIAEIAAASQEQSQGIAQVNTAVTQMDHVVQQAAARTEGLASTAQLLAAQAQQLQVLVGRFKVGQRASAPGLVAAAAALKAGARPTRPSMGLKATPTPGQPALVEVWGDRASSGLEDGFQES
jgi:methyl-accepting chemotaxis protein